jgi:replicative DNA helicase
MISNLAEKLAGEHRFYAFVFEDPENVKKKILLRGLIPAGREVKSDVFIDPDSAFAVFADEDHFIGNVKASETVKKSFKTYEGLLEEVEQLIEGHSRKGVEITRVVLDGDLKH